MTIYFIPGGLLQCTAPSNCCVYSALWMYWLTYDIELTNSQKSAFKILDTFVAVRIEFITVRVRVLLRVSHRVLTTRLIPEVAIYYYMVIQSKCTLVYYLSLYSTTTGWQKAKTVPEITRKYWSTEVATCKFLLWDQWLKCKIRGGGTLHLGWAPDNGRVPFANINLI